MQQVDGYKKGMVSCVCLTYNHAEFLGKCIESIWEQKYRNVEILALDDGSTDDSASVLQDYAQRSPVPMKVILQKNSGNIAKNFNTLIREAQGEFITIVSTDDFFASDAFSSKMPFFGQDKKMCFVGNLVSNTVDENDNIIARDSSFVDWKSERHETVEDMVETLFYALATIRLQGTVFRKVHVDAVKGFDEDFLGDDFILFTKIFLYMLEHPELNFKVMDKVAINYRHHSSGLSKNRFRAVPMYVEWKLRYFPDREVPARLFETFKCGLKAALADRNQIQLQEIISLLNSLLEKESEESRSRFMDLLLGEATTKRRYLIPFVFELKDKKDFFSRRTSLIILGIKALERVEKFSSVIGWFQLKVFNIPVFQKFLTKSRASV